MYATSIRTLAVLGVALGLLVVLPGYAVADQHFSGFLSPSSPMSQVHRSGCYYQIYRVFLAGGQVHTIDLRSNDFDSYLILLDGAGSFQVARDDDSGGFPHARIQHFVAQGGWYQVMVTTYRQGATGSYDLHLSGGGPIY